MSSPTLTLVATPDPEPSPSVQALADRLVLAGQCYGDLLAAAKAAVAAEAAGMAYPLGWLRDHLALLGELPPAGARPGDFVPMDAGDAVWGRW